MGLWTHAKKSSKMEAWPTFWNFVQEDVILLGTLPTLSPISTFAIKMDPKAIFFCRAKGLSFDSRVHSQNKELGLHP
jgi:hypothetical protein